LLALIVPLWNQWECSKACLESLEAALLPGSFRLILVDNGSKDGTAAGLKEFRGRLGYDLIRNARNLGCAPAWNQGVRRALKLGANWIGVLNNDLVLSPGMPARLIREAEARGLDIASPATREGGLHYGLEERALWLGRRQARRNAPGWFGWCFFARAAVFRKVGLFDEGFRLGIGEDEDFMRRAGAAGFKLGLAGSAFVHHFGSRSLAELRRLKGKGFEEANIKRLRARWGAPKARSPFSKAADALGRAWELARWGAPLKG
jgi:GT2 family glycosyltransferase